MICPKCNGRGFIELEHGIFTRSCSECKGKGEVIDSSSGTGQLDTNLGNEDTGKPKQRKKLSSKKKARKGSS